MANLKWYIDRAKVMNIGEIIHRLKCKKYDYKIESGYRLSQNNYKINYIELPELCIINDFQKNEIIKNANKILQNRMDIFGEEFVLDYDNKFLKDPVSKKDWSNLIYTKVNFRKSNLPGDPKLIWEINKQQYLLDLALAYQVTNDKMYAEKIITEIMLWINQNNEYHGINWTSGLEMSLRCLSWIYSLSLIKDYLEKYNVNIQKILHYIRIQTEFVFNKLSLFSSANNHLIGELTLILYSSYFVECAESEIWRERAINLLNNQIENQFYNDGVNKEQSVNYQIHTMELYFLCEYILNLNNMSLKKKTLEMLKRACDYLYKLSESDGTVFNIGDEDGGHILKIESRGNSILDILQFGSLILKDKKIYGKKVGSIDYKLLMMFGKTYLEFIGDMDRDLDDDLKTYIFKEGGIYIRNGSLGNIPYKAMLDFGSIGMAPLNAHAHCDILSFNMNFNKKKFLVDSGTYKYHKDEGFRNYFRGVSAHNTISIDDENQFEFLGPFMCEKSPKTILDNIDNNSVKCTSDMYKSKKCIVSREILFLDDRITIVDFIENNSSIEVEAKVYFNFDYNVKIKEINNKYICNVGGKDIIIDTDINCKTDLIRGYDGKYKLGWHSNKFYNLNETNTLICNKIINSKCKEKIITKIYI